MPRQDDTERNKAVIAQFPALLRAPDPAAIQALFTEDFRLQDAKYPDWPRGHDGAVRIFQQLRVLMPDIEAGIEDMFGAGDRLCVRWRYKGTLASGSGAHFEGVGISIYRFRDGRIAENWGTDMLLLPGHPWRKE
jgi:ketosteroid isomerase-like protein